MGATMIKKMRVIAVFIMAFLAISVINPSYAANEKKKIIAYFLDGTWNGPDRIESDEGLSNNPYSIALVGDLNPVYNDENHPTNVFKLFNMLGGARSELDKIGSMNTDLEINGKKIIARYIHGVGDSRVKIIKSFNGAVAADIFQRISDGYKYISENYNDGDEIILVGFSRGAFGVRVLADLLLDQGALRLEGDNVWDDFLGFIERRKAIYRHLNKIFKGNIENEEKDDGRELRYKKIDSIKALAVFDTVASVGVTSLLGFNNVNELVIDDTSGRIKNIYHAVSLDERRDNFSPVLWRPSKNVTQRLFPGAHADVGGGYPLGAESGLSDGPYKWMAGNLIKMGLRFTEKDGRFPWTPNPKGMAHQPWNYGIWKTEAVKKSTRQFNAGDGFSIDESIRLRQKAGLVPVEVRESVFEPQIYAPTNLPVKK
jgi:hypothetical protein